MQAMARTNNIQRILTAVSFLLSTFLQETNNLDAQMIAVALGVQAV
jgi:hypothetical protein